MKHKKTILLFGPTASGKTKLSIDLAKKFKGEIINADSMQVYKEIKILSARPNEKKIKHHLYGFVSVKDNFSAGIWYNLVAQKIKNINRIFVFLTVYLVVFYVQNYNRLLKF